LLICCAGCAGSATGFDAIAERHGLIRGTVAGDPFIHVVYRPSAQPAMHDSASLHVYLTGDGRPYVRRSLAAADPTPRHPVIPALMALDPAPRLLLGRPCYHGLADAPGCEPAIWTNARYGDAVVTSLAAALRRLNPERRPLRLVGHSGGAALAVLLSRRLPNVTDVITLAGNLDPDAWTAHHGLSPLDGSLNPLADGALPERIAQAHYAAARDRNVPVALIRPAAQRLGSTLRVLPDTGHQSGWPAHWRRILRNLDAPRGRGSQ
jgi:pimeloyl-ACP methyl ester carboxylesterase